jgi:diacylglycerol kinase (ATP)
VRSADRRIVRAGAFLGGAIGAAAAVALARRLAARRPAAPQAPPASACLPPEAVLVTSPHAGGSRGLAAALRTMESYGIRVTAQLDVRRLAELPAMTGGGQARLVIAAGGDGTVGGVADRLANSAAVLGILPLGTSNDFARSLGIPANPQRAAALLATGKISTVDLGRLQVPGQPARHFAHAATVGMNVSFARLATRASVRARLGRFTYLAAAASAFRERTTFGCELHHSGRAEKLTLAQLSVINAPVFGGALGLSVPGSNPDDRLLDVLAIEDIPARRMLLAALFLLLRISRPVAGIRALHVTSLHVHTGQPLDVALDGEVAANLPGDFDVAGEALRIVTPQDFEDIDD